MEVVLEGSPRRTCVQEDGNVRAVASNTGGTSDSEVVLPSRMKASLMKVHLEVTQVVQKQIEMPLRRPRRPEQVLLLLQLPSQSLLQRPRRWSSSRRWLQWRVASNPAPAMPNFGAKPLDAEHPGTLHTPRSPLACIEHRSRGPRISQNQDNPDARSSRNWRRLTVAARDTGRQYTGLELVSTRE